MPNAIKMNTARPEYASGRPGDAGPSGAPSPEARDDFEKAMREKGGDDSEKAAHEKGGGDAEQALHGKSGNDPEKALIEKSGNGLEEPLRGKGGDNPEKAVREKHKDDSGGSGGNDREDSRDGQTLPSASSLLHSLFEGKMNAVAAPAVAAPAAAGADLGELVDDLVQRILVSEPKPGDSTEIRLQLSESALPGTEIRLQRGPDGLLNVWLETRNASSMQTLVSGQQSLREQLEKHGPVNVRVSGADGSGQSDNDANQRSRGLMDYGPETL